MPCESGRRPRVVIVGAGFGGLAAAKRLADQPIDVTMIDQRNYHLSSRSCIKSRLQLCRLPTSLGRSAASLRRTRTFELCSEGL
jgi:NADH dehydrogenase FAD-containing subunit